MGSDAPVVLPLRTITTYQIWLAESFLYGFPADRHRDGLMLVYKYIVEFFHIELSF
jgi:hypothetical protein